MHRFFISPLLIQPETASLPPEAARQAAVVLRLKSGDLITVLDNQGWEYVLCLEQVSARAASGRIVEKHLCTAEPAARVWLYQALTSREKFEWILQKGTELGMAGITPVISTRSLVRGGTTAKQPRWQRILQEAAEQSGRGYIPIITPPQSLAEALKTACRPNSLTLFAWEEETVLGLSGVMREAGHPQQVSIFIGPEGGFTAEEAASARQMGANVVTLGRRILRTETAAVTCLALVMQSLGELG